MTNARIALTTAGSAEEARRIAQGLVERRLAACVNIVPQVESIFRWQDKIENALEFLLVIKTEAGVSDDLCDAIKELHSYELPECVMLEIRAGSSQYLDWIEENVG